MRYWLMKSEPSEVSFEDVLRAPAQTVGWFGVRNYQARNFMRDLMRIGDRALFYHSGIKNPGVAGVVEVCSVPYADPTQFDAMSGYFDAKASVEEPRWWQVDVRVVQSTRYLPLSELRAHPGLAGMRILQRGNRLSITPVTDEEWQLIAGLLGVA